MRDWSWACLQGLGSGTANGLRFGSRDGFKPLEFEGLRMRFEGVVIRLAYFPQPLSPVFFACCLFGEFGAAGLRMGFE